jgi:hypothetical protein
VVAWACGPPKRMNITPKSLIDFKEFARDVRRSAAEFPATRYWTRQRVRLSAKKGA